MLLQLLLLPRVLTLLQPMLMLTLTLTLLLLLLLLPRFRHPPPAPAAARLLQLPRRRRRPLVPKRPLPFGHLRIRPLRRARRRRL